MQQELNQLDVKSMGRRIRVIRESKKITREELAEKVDLSVTFITDIEYGNKCPSVKSLYLLCQALESKADYVLGGVKYDADEEEEAAELCREIIGILKKCDIDQIKGFRDISLIYTASLMK